MAEFIGCKLTMELQAQMPMIHFQSEQCGATLRASEMKPKFDAFLLNEMGKKAKKSIKELKKDSNYERFFLDALSDANNALDYKVQITMAEPCVEIELNKKAMDKREPSQNYAIYYGNMGKKPGEKLTYGIFSNPTVTIICFKEELRKLIKENIVDFFLTTNFGTMQNKGFGSFVPTEWVGTKNGLTEMQVRDVAKAYKKISPNGKCYVMDFRAERHTNMGAKNIACVAMSDAIKEFYSIMKSGKNFGKYYIRSYIYQYGKEKNMGNEKAWMKRNKIAPAVSTKDIKHPDDFPGQEEKYKYLRAFLGIGEKIEYGLDKKTNDRGMKVIDKTIVKQITIKNTELERLSSPIYFKVINNKVFVVAFDVPQEVFGKEFEFTSKKIDRTDKKNEKVTPGESGKLCVPQSFDIHDFLESYVTKYNQDFRKKNNSEPFPELRTITVKEEVNINA